MKSRTSCFDKTLFLKNLTRFAPAWGLYTVFLLLSILMIFGGSDYFPRELSYTTPGFGFINFVYALICALLLFGDLYNPRLCNAIHAMPVRRESLFVTNILSGLCFSLGPTLVAMIISLGLSVNTVVINGVYVPLLTFAAANLQFLFFFGIAVLCAFLVGSRFAMALIYGILNFGSLLVFWLVDTLYTPMLYGLKTLEEPFLLLCPMVQMVGSNYLNSTSDFNSLTGFSTHTITIGEGWGYVGICAAIGVAFMGLALLLYRRRKLECAGDFMAERVCEPVFLVIYSLVVGCVFQFVWRIFIRDDVPVLLFIGLSIGFFTGLMLLKRTVRVFQLKSFVGCIALTLAMGLSLVVTLLDPFGIQRWMPQVNEVKSVTLYQNQSLNNSPGQAVTLDDPEDIEAILQVHDAALNQKNSVASSDGWVTVSPYDEKIYFEDLRSFSFTLEYRLNNGAVLRRYYQIWVQTEAGTILKDFFTSVECVLGVPESELAQLAQELDYIMLNTYHIYDKAEILSFLQAVAADCNMGTMAQNWAFRDDNETWENIMDIHCVLELDRNTSYLYYIQVFDTNENILNWMEYHNVPTYQELEEKYPNG